MIVIVESGATKTDWCAVSQEGLVGKVSSAGINTALMSAKEISNIVSESAAAFAGENVTSVYFYAAGIVLQKGERVPGNLEFLDSVLHQQFPLAEISYASDLLAAARSLLGRSSGIAAIMGTGSNSCFYDGERIVKNIRPAGFILGDEGSAACLGKLFMADFLKDLVPEPISSEFAAEFHCDYLTVVRKVYGSSSPSKYLGSFAPWIIGKYDSSDYVKELVDNNFRSFARRVLKQYDYLSCPVGITGGFALACEDIIRKLFSQEGIRVSSVCGQPLEGLIKYHCKYD